jgi:hypothetical protein
LLLNTLVLSACGGGGGGGGGNSIGGGNSQSAWLIPQDEVVDGGPGIDGIPALENPSYESAVTNTTLAPDDLVIALRSDGQTKVFPHDIMDWHELVNDGPSDDPVIMSYCPLTGSAMAWKGRASDADATFGVSGLLYNSNLVLYDRATRSFWSQMLQLSVNGSRIRERPETIQVIETTFATLTDMYPDALVMTRDTGHSRNYDQYPYGDYLTSTRLLFDVSRADSRLHPKERAIGICENDACKVYQLEGFGTSTQAINEQFNDQSIVVIGNSALNIAAIYNRQLSDGTILTFDPLQDELPNIMSDTEGNVWDIFGTAVSGPRSGEQLDTTQSYTAMWFAWVALFDPVDVHFN